MPDSTDILWFKNQFERADRGRALPARRSRSTCSPPSPARRPATSGRRCAQDLPLDRILALCVGDTLDARQGPQRLSADTKADARSPQPRGEEMFDIARQALVDMAQHVPGFEAAAKRRNKFCHGFGIFQLDLQFFREDPDYFLRSATAFERHAGEVRWASCSAALKQARPRGPRRRSPTSSGGGRHRLQHRRLQAREGTEAGALRRHAVLRRGSLRLPAPGADRAAAGRAAPLPPPRPARPSWRSRRR